MRSTRNPSSSVKKKRRHSILHYIRRYTMTALIKSILLSAALALLMAGTAQAKDEKAPAASKPATSANAAADKAEKSKSGDLIDINTASEKELATLPKIGDAR